MGLTSAPSGPSVRFDPRSPRRQGGEPDKRLPLEADKPLRLNRMGMGFKPDLSRRTWRTITEIAGREIPGRPRALEVCPKMSGTRSGLSRRMDRLTILEELTEGG